MEMKELTPKKIVQELDRYIIGQEKAKKAVAVSLRNRYRRSLLPEEERDEFTPKNIILMGPTGVGKTEIARRIAKLVSAPFIKVEATKFTEVGYVGRDVESMVRDLVTTAIRKVQQEKMKEVYEQAKKIADEQILDALVPQKKKEKKMQESINPMEILSQFTSTGKLPSIPMPNQNNSDDDNENTMDTAQIATKRSEIKKQLDAGLLENDYIDIEVDDDGMKSIGLMAGMNEDVSITIGNIFDGLLPGGNKKKKKRNIKVSDARKLIANQEAQKMIDMDEVHELGRQEAEQNGIIFIDEIDKIIGNHGGTGPDVSREGVQRDILPIVEGSTVNTKYGPVKTDFILFIGAGAFHVSKIEDMIPELQGRFPVTVNLDSLTEEDFVNILTAPENAVVKQYSRLLKTEGINLVFKEEAIKQIAKIAYTKNEVEENIGARRLHTVFEELLEEISFYASEYEQEDFIIDENYVNSVFKVFDQERSYAKYFL